MNNGVGYGGVAVHRDHGENLKLKNWKKHQEVY
jgi:hypothetical protein